MSPLDTQKLLKRLAELKSDLKTQHSMPKTDRDERHIAQLKQAIAKIHEWQGEPAKQEALPKSPKRLKKEIFRDQYKKQFGIEEPTEVMEIESIKMLDEVWAAIAGKNIQIKAPADVKAEIARRVREMRNRQRVNGFR